MLIEIHLPCCRSDPSPIVVGCPSFPTDHVRQAVQHHSFHVSETTEADDQRPNNKPNSPLGSGLQVTFWDMNAHADVQKKPVRASISEG